MNMRPRGQLGIAPVVVYAAITGITTALSLILGRKRGAQKRATTAIVNDLEPLLQQNVAAYLASPRTQADQAAALANFDSAWRELTSSQFLGNPELGEPGNRAIADRGRGGKWDWFSYYRDPIANDHAVASSPAAEWDWFSYYRDPIANDHAVASSPAADIVGQIFSGQFVTAEEQGNAALFAGAALLLVGVLL